MSTEMPERGSKISLISKADIRYEGQLFSVNPQDCTIGLVAVRLFGTEDRETRYPVPAENQVYDFIMFQGSDIKDIRVINNVPALPNDPATIMQLSVPPSLGQQQFQFQAFSHPVLGLMGPAMGLFNAGYGGIGGIGGLAPGMGIAQGPRVPAKQPNELIMPGPVPLPDLSPAVEPLRPNEHDAMDETLQPLASSTPKKVAVNKELFVPEELPGEKMAEQELSWHCNEHISGDIILRSDWLFSQMDSLQRSISLTEFFQKRSELADISLKDSPKNTAPMPLIDKSVQTSSPVASFTFGTKSIPSSTSSPVVTANIFSSPPTSILEFKPVPASADTTTPQKCPQSATSPETPVEEFEPSVDFQPVVVPLPELVEIKTGEENSEILFESRAKLQLYDAASKEWKERGVGIIKLLKENTVRLLMRREQVHKICCNHQLLRSMQFTRMLNNPKALTWYAQDYSEGVLKTEMFAIRFKLEEDADEFYKAVTRMQELLDENNMVTSDDKVVIFEIKADVKDDGRAKSKEDKKVKSSEPEKMKVEMPKSADRHKPKLGSWECKNCFIVNDGKAHLCVACETSKSSTTPKKCTESFFGTRTTVVSSPSTQSFSCGQKVYTPTISWGDAFKPVEGEAEAKPTEESQDRFVFVSPQKHTFEFTPRSPRRHSSGYEGDVESDSFVEDDGDDINSKQVIPLPDKVDVKTGEEQEEMLYCHRATLFRIVQGEWKNRGIGDIKILLKIETGKLRVLMRRDQVLKICLDHILTPDIEYVPKDEKTWQFSAPDYSEGEINHWQFCLKFKTADVANGFKHAIDGALERTAKAAEGHQEDDDEDDRYVPTDSS